MAALIAAGLGALLTAIGAAGAAALVTSAIGVAIIGLGVSLAVSYGVSLFLQQGQNPVQKPSDGQQTVKQPLAPRTRSYGRVRVSGALWWMAASNTTPSTLYQGIALNQGEIDSFYSLHIDENQVDVDVNSKVTTSPYATDNVYLKRHTGTYPETDYTDLQTVFGISHIRGDGVATILAEITNPATVDDFTKTYPNSRPLIRATINATKVWDPRDPSQVRTDTSTYVWSDNAVLCLLHYMLSADGYGMPWSRFENNIDEWKAAADICDEDVMLLTGETGKRYRVAGTYAFTDNPKDVVERFQSVCDGRVWQRRDGSMGVTVGRFVEPTITISDRNIVGYEGMTYGQDPLSAVAGLRAQYMSPEHDYREHEPDPWPDGPTVLALSEDRVISLDLLWVPSNSQARRLMKRIYKRLTADWHGTVTTNLAGLQAIDERYVRIQIAELGIDRAFEIDQFTFDRQSRTCALQVRTIDASIDAWNPAEEEGAAENLTLSIASTFTKTGTTLNVLSEAGATFGQAAFVFVTDILNTVLPAVPTGWTRQFFVNQANNYDSAIYWKVIDGTEGVGTFLSSIGAITVIVFNGLPNPQFHGNGTFLANLSQGGTNDTVYAQNPVPPAQQLVNAPFALMAVWAIGADTSDPDSPAIHNAAKGTLQSEFIENRIGTVTQNVAIYILGADSTPEISYGVESVDHGINVIVGAFFAEPG